MKLANKKVLLVGLGILGGGLSMAKFLISKGARLTITDLRNENELGVIIKKLPSSVKYTLRKHAKKDFKEADVIVFNPAVSYFGKWVKLAQRLKKEFYNDYTFFLKNLETIKPSAIIIGITGTRGKTTTSTWINHLIPGSVLAGNIPEKNLLKQMTKKSDIFVLELSSFQLEYANCSVKSPNIAVFTNLHVDHLNRYGTMGRYRDVKFNIFKNQTKSDVLVLNKDQEVTKLILAKRPKAQLFFISQKPLSKKLNGLYFDNDKIFYQFNDKKTLATKYPGLAPHEKANLLTAMLVAHLSGVEGKEIETRIKNLPTPIFRQQKIFDKKGLRIINDSAGASPDGTIAAIEKFKGKDFYLITGGTNKKLEFTGLAAKIKKSVPKNHLYLLSGSGTEELKKHLGNLHRNREVKEFDGLEEIVRNLYLNVKKGTIVFSPGCASFEKFKNEFDRGKQFNKFVKKHFGKDDS